MDQGTLQGIATIFAMAAFIGVCWWAYSGHKKKDFDEAAQLPFLDEKLGEELDDGLSVSHGKNDSQQALQDSLQDSLQDKGKEQDRS